MTPTGAITGMNLSISAWPNVLKLFLRNLASLEAPAPKTGPPDGVQAKIKVKHGVAWLVRKGLSSPEVWPGLAVHSDCGLPSMLTWCLALVSGISGQFVDLRFLVTSTVLSG